MAIGPGDCRLALELAVGQRGVEGGANIGGAATGIRQRQTYRFADHVVNRPLKQASKRRHANAYYVNFVHRVFPLGIRIQRPWNCGARFSANACKPSWKSALRMCSRIITCS